MPKYYVYSGNKQRLIDKENKLAALMQYISDPLEYNEHVQPFIFIDERGFDKYDSNTWVMHVPSMYSGALVIQPLKTLLSPLCFEDIRETEKKHEKKEA